MSTASYEITLIGPGDEAVLSNVESGVFDQAVQLPLAAEFLADPRHHLVVARYDGRVVGFASAVHYVHPDKPAELWVNEVGVAQSHQGKGLAKQILRSLFDAGLEAGCTAAWVLTERSNAAAMGLYRTIGGVAAGDETVMFEFQLEAAGKPPVASTDHESKFPAPIRMMRPAERPDVLAMMQALWPEAGDYDFSDETVLVWERPAGSLGGFISLSLRPWAEGCESTPVPYIEGWWVAPDLRRAGVGRALFEAVELWCRDHGYDELGSDVEVDNTASLEAHQALGFEPTLQLQYFCKRLG